MKTQSFACRTTPPDAVCQRWPGYPESVTAARHWLEEQLAGVPSEASYLALTIATELVTNAIRHTRSGERADGVIGEFEVTVQAFPTCVIVAVADQGADTEPTAATLDPEEVHLGESGRGLAIVALLARRWGHRPYGDGRQTWATIARRTP